MLGIVRRYAASGVAALLICTPALADRAGDMAAAIDAGLVLNLGIGSNVKIEGKTKVTPKGDVYRAELPTLRFMGEDGGAIVLAGIKATLTPAGDGIDVVATLPAELQVLKSDGRKAGRIAIGRHDIQGHWMNAIRNFSRLDATIDSFQAVEGKNGRPFRTGRSRITYKFEENAGKLWDGSYHIEIGDILATPEGKGKGQLGIDRVTLDAGFTNYDMVAYAAWVEKAAANSGKLQGDSPQARKALAELIGTMPQMIGSGNGRFGLEGLALDTGGAIPKIDIASMSFDMAANGVETGSATLSTGYGLSGLKVDPPPPFGEFVPSSAAYKLSINKLPTDKLHRGLTNLLLGSAGGNEDAAAEAFFGELLTALNETGSELRLDSLSFAAPDLGGEATGGLKLVPGATHGFTAELEFRLRGFEKALATVSELGKSDPDARNAAGVLSLVNAMGTPAKDVQGRDIRVYKLDLAADGKLQLNGNDLAPLLEMARDEPADEFEEEEEYEEELDASEDEVQ